MEVLKQTNGASAELKLIGRLDTTTAPQLESELESLGSGVTDLTLNFESLVYISSAGLRVLLKAQKDANGNGGSMTLTHVNEEIMDVFEMTGFSSFLNII